MSSKHFVNDPDHLVLSSLHSITSTNPTVALDRDNRIVYVRPDAIEPQVSLVSGGGAGHEPSFAAFVGRGVLSAAVSGTIFASPSAEQVRHAILQRVDTSRGVLVIVMNYTGDVLNFGMGVEKARAAGVPVDMVIVGDDTGVGRAQGGKVGRRGIAGTVLVHKIAGALAALGAELQAVRKVAQLVADNIISIGSSLSHVHVPGRAAGDDDNNLSQDEVEIGMGIHNEPGSEKTKKDLKDLVKTMLGYMLDPDDRDRAFLSVTSTDDTVLLVNNLGGVSVLEMGAITHEVVSQLAETKGIRPKRVLSGTFMTSLNGLGFSISLLKVQDTGVDRTMIELLDAPSECNGWATPIQPSTWTRPPIQTRSNKTDSDGENEACGLEIESALAKKVLAHALQKLIDAEPEITKQDTILGDGDCGIGLKRGAQAILHHLSSSMPQNDAALFVDKITTIVERTMDGTSGALYAIYLNALAAALRTVARSGTKTLNPRVWGEILARAMQNLAKYTPAKPGDRTLVDALHPFIEQLQSTGNVTEAARAAEQGAAKTQGMRASLGRAAYSGGDGYKQVPDAGAHGLAVFLSGIAEGLK